MFVVVVGVFVVGVAVVAAGAVVLVFVFTRRARVPKSTPPQTTPCCKVMEALSTKSCLAKSARKRRGKSNTPSRVVGPSGRLPLLPGSSAGSRHLLRGMIAMLSLR